MELIRIDTEHELLAYAESRIGGRVENQDSYGTADTPLGFLAVVCDGMGGGPAGKLASTIAVNAIIEYVNEADQEKSTKDVLVEAIWKANDDIMAQGVENPALAGMGSTCVTLLINEHSATIAYVGDSRVYQFRGSNKIYRSFDHSMVFDLVKQKIITEEQARLSVQSNVITKCLGARPELEPDVVEVSYRSGDRFLLCTDGIHGSLPESELIAMVTNKDASLGQVVDEVATHVDGHGRSTGGGHDNLTLLMTEMKSNSLLKSASNGKWIAAVVGAVVVLVALVVLAFVLL
ncbi:MAG: serine/threonine-protein phosphatase [Alistipes sp.]|nr:serine/threonine-protein phosphatase [Alistipes sp.]